MLTGISLESIESIDLSQSFVLPESMRRKGENSFAQIDRSLIDSFQLSTMQTGQVQVGTCSVVR